MTIEEAIADIRDNIKPVVGGKSLDMAIKALETCDNLFKSYEVLTKKITESGDIKNSTKQIDDWCIEQLRGIISDYYADLIIKEDKV